MPRVIQPGYPRSEGGNGERTAFIAVSRSRSKFRILLGEILNLEEVSMISVIAPCNLKMPSTSSSSFTLSVP